MDIAFTLLASWFALALLLRAKRRWRQADAWEERSRRDRARSAEIRRQMEGRDGDAA